MIVISLIFAAMPPLIISFIMPDLTFMMLIIFITL